MTGQEFNTPPGPPVPPGSNSGRQPERPANPYAAGPEESQSGTVAFQGQQRGLVGQVSVLGILMIVHGVIDCLAAVGAGIYAVMMPMVFAQLQNQPNSPQLDGAQIQNMTLFTGIFLGVMAAALLITGILLILSGIGLTRFERRGMAMTALSLGLLTLFSCYCFPTSLALGIYGMIVLLNPSVTAAFEMRRQGHTANDVLKTFLLLP